ncbi:MAG: hypothetical protein AAF335_04900 [Bacteroidota bacterium]
MIRKPTHLQRWHLVASLIFMICLKVSVMASMPPNLITKIRKELEKPIKLVRKITE